MMTKRALSPLTRTSSKAYQHEQCDMMLAANGHCLPTATGLYSAMGNRTMTRTHALIQCQICRLHKPMSRVLPGELVRESLVEVIRAHHAGWKSDGFICLDDLNAYRMEYIRNNLAQVKGELSALDETVLSSLGEQDPLTRNLNEEFDTQLTLGERIADKVATYGGSWKFIANFSIVMAIWITLNSLQWKWQAFDPYPYILLNLVLSCMSAVQAPFIMMSQNRIEAKDRMRSKHDYRINLKAELEIQSLNTKIDLLLNHQWQRLLEIQQIQAEMMKELMSYRNRDMQRHPHEGDKA